MTKINMNGGNVSSLMRKALGVALIGFAVYTICGDSIGPVVKDVAANISRKEES